MKVELIDWTIIFIFSSSKCTSINIINERTRNERRLGRLSRHWAGAATGARLPVGAGGARPAPGPTANGSSRPP